MKLPTLNGWNSSPFPGEFDQNAATNILEKWKKLLGLTDWDIKISFRDALDLDTGPARSNHNPNLQTADIRILAMNDRQASHMSDSDPESDIVHELIHIRLWPIDPKENDIGRVHSICREQSIEWIAKALINLDRNRQP